MKDDSGQKTEDILIGSHFKTPFPLGFKVAMEMRGFDMGPPKQPLSDAERFKYRTTKARIEKIMKPILQQLKQPSKISRSAVS
jgi:hypothetical protein